MPYNILKPLMQAALRLYFGRIVTQGLEHIDNGRPTLVLANHTASFMDAVVTACFVRRRIYFFTRGDVFGNKWADAVLRSLGMLPIYRMSDGRDKLRLNDSSNDEALKILARGGAVLIFVEGASDIAKVLKPLKKGPFRLAVTAAGTLAVPPVLVPMGINYVTPVRPFGDLFLNASAPIPVPLTGDGSESGAARAATKLMRETAEAIRPLVWHIGRPEHTGTGDALLEALGHVRPSYTFEDTRRLLDRLNSGDGSLFTGQPGTDRATSVSRQEARRPLDGLILIVFAPVALAGFLGNYLPVSLAVFITDSRVKEPDFRAPVLLSLAVVLILTWYLLLFIAGSLSGRGMLMTVLTVLIAACGVAYLKWYRPALFRALSARKSARSKLAGYTEFIRSALGRQDA